MAVKKVNIEIPKLDYQIILLSIKDNGRIVQLQEEDRLYFTVSLTPDTTDYIIQKSLNNGIEYNQETGKYELEITSEDTKNLKLDYKYGYDITIYYGGDKPKQKVIGTFVVSDKFTMNEGR